MKPRSDRSSQITGEDQWHSILGQCDLETVPAFDAEKFATQVRLRQRLRSRTQRRRFLVGGGISMALLLVVIARPTWDRSTASHPRAEHAVPMGSESTGGPDTAPDDGVVAEATVQELDSVIQQLASGVEALTGAERTADERRRLDNAASRAVNQIRQQAELSVFYSHAPRDPPAS